MIKDYIVIAYTENHPGVLNRITTLYLRRKINIECLKVSESSIKGISRFVITAFTTEVIMNKLVKQLRDIIDVIEVEFYTQEELISQEMGMYKIKSAADQGMSDKDIDALISNWGAHTVEKTPKFVVIEYTGRRSEVEEFRLKVKEKGILLEFTRSGTVVFHRDSTESILESRLRSL